MPRPRMKRVTSADMFLNNMPVPVASIEFDSDDYTADEALNQVSERFRKMLSIKYHEKLVKPVIKK